MPYTSLYIDGGKGVLKTGSGVVTGPEIISVAREFSLDEIRLCRLVYALVDFSDIEEMRVTPDEVRLIVEIHRKTAALTPGALVAIFAQDPLAYAISRFWHSYSENLGWKATVVHTRTEAIAWLRRELALDVLSANALAQFPTLLNTPSHWTGRPTAT
jgi:hypothetical protein